MLALTVAQNTSYSSGYGTPLVIGRPVTKKGTATPFGKVVDKLVKSGKSSRAKIAKELGVSKAYIGMWCRGDATPGFKVSFEIEDWAKKKGMSVPVASWRPFIK